MSPSYEMPSAIAMRLLATVTMAGAATTYPSMSHAHFALQWGVHEELGHLPRSTRWHRRHGRPSKEEQLAKQQYPLLWKGRLWWNTRCTWRGLVTLCLYDRCVT